MAQAKTLTQDELNKVLAYVAGRSYALRNRTMLLVSFYAGMRVGEIASLKVGDVMAQDGKVRAEVRLTADQTKGRHPRIVFLPTKLREELQNYLNVRAAKDAKQPLFITSGRRAFSANVLCQHFFWQYKRAGVEGASSHSGRRTFLTSLANKGVSIHVLASLAGHRSVQVTMKYLSANDDMKRNAVELV